MGQLLDQFGRSIGFASPCGKKIEELAEKKSNYIPLPYSVQGNDVSFSGLLSATKDVAKQGVNDACYSLQETAFAMICEATERALAFTKKKGADDSWWRCSKQKIVSYAAKYMQKAKMQVLCGSTKICW